MKRIFLIVVFSLVGLLGGAAAGMFLAPQPDPKETEAVAGHGDGAPADASAETAHATDQTHGGSAGEASHDAGHGAAGGEPARNVDYVKLDRQFVVPVVDDGEVNALIVLSIAVEVAEGAGDIVFEEEPKLRDAFLKVFFKHSQSGGFAGDFTRESRMADLRGRLYEAAREVLGSTAKGVLLTNVLRQDS